MRIPMIDARTLARRTVRVPGDFTGVRNVLVIAFERSHLIVYPSWRAALARTLSEQHKSGCYALLLAGEKSGWRRRMIELGVRMETPDWHAIEHTAIAYVDPTRWCGEAGFALPDLPLVVVTDATGNVHATAEGDPGPIASSRLAAAFRV